jgi:hypothetical protein
MEHCGWGADGTGGKQMTTWLNPLVRLPIIGTLTVLSAGPVLAGSLDDSMADALSARFIADGFLTILPPVAPAQGSAPPAYNKTTSTPLFDETLDIANKLAPPPALFVHLTGIADHAIGSGIGIDSFSSAGDSTIATAALSLNLNPPPPTATAVPFVPLQIGATAVQANASFSVVVPQPPVVTGNTNFGHLTITGSLVGNKVLTFSGTPPVNHVLFTSPEVTITLNEQLIVGALVTCFPGQGCKVIPGGIFVRPVHVRLTNANIFGRIVSGSIILGQAQAGGGQIATPVPTPVATQQAN